MSDGAAPADYHRIRTRVEALARRGRFDEAYRLGLELLAAVSPGTLEAAGIENVLGGIAFEQGKTDEADARFEAALRTARRLGDVSLVARATNNLASIAHLRGKLTLATSLYESALTVFEQEASSKGEAQTCHNLAILRRERGQSDEAANYADRAVRAARRSGDFALESLTLAGRAEAALKRGDLERARRDVLAARRIARRTRDGLGLAEAARLSGAIALAENHPTEALFEARQGYQRAHRLGALPIATECAELAARACRMLQRMRQSRRFYQIAVDGYHTLGAAQALRKLRATWDR
jgi:tetratricopeptide (TPR) repeat protein